ncbi:putative GNAT family N-acyltransferase [Aneurinibacillus soli]|uniref:Putative N-acetyltransferase YjcF n=1 Tax=Aneurinibacillus soli TaxID=1500254 RepID=A0A0U5B8G1_9BACL|nr:GNAT family N-acetyltransferase [Aneurinibacillus soli]PYE61325.1 putative GNAT family N-acyltransferase [Aneurinibacillus soli]BAU27846.1 putative N-acetyltransferase YjcF [Aneurinibacillus soli]
MEAKVITTEEQQKVAFDIRVRVFVEEQNVPLEEELDEFEAESTHFLLYKDGVPVGAGRFRIVDGVGKVERICVLPAHRSGGSGGVIMRAIEEYAVEQGMNKLKLHGQTHAEGFYHKLGYETVSDVFLEAGIPHVIMTKKLVVM